MLALLDFGANAAVEGASALAKKFRLSDLPTDLTIVTFGTSVPELVVSVIGSVEGYSDIAIGNVIGANIFNILLILSISTLIQPIDYNSQFNVEVYILIGGTVFLFMTMLSGKRKKLDRWEAALLVGFYLVYTTYLIMGETELLG